MDMIVVLEFRQWEKVIPIILPLIYEKPQVLFQFLIDPFRLSVSLWMVGSSCRQLDSEQSVNFPSEFRNELRSPVGNHVKRESVQFPDMVKIQSGRSQCGDCCVCRNEVCSF